jgi:hypothetical protein
VNDRAMIEPRADHTVTAVPQLRDDCIEAVDADHHGGAGAERIVRNG